MDGIGAFKERVKEFVELHDQLAASSKQLTALRKKKDEMSQGILVYMKENGLDECELSDGKLSRRTSKRTETLKRDTIAEVLKATVGDEKKVATCIDRIFSQRPFTISETLARTRARGGAGSNGAD
jgi:hypothetical protein